MKKIVVLGAGMVGRVMAVDLAGEQEGDLIILDLVSLEPGLYLLNVTRNHESEYFKILKSR